MSTSTTTINGQRNGLSHISAPTEHTPYWHDPRDSTPRHLLAVLAGLDPHAAAHIEELHADAVRQLVAAALTARRRGEHRAARAHASAAARLAGQIVGLWPTQPTTSKARTP